jgi:hypothetical protein
LKNKRRLGVTQEILDALLLNELITPDQQQAALHLRWLYAVCYGAARVKAYDIESRAYRGLEHNLLDEKWLIAKRKEYLGAMSHLKRHGYDQLMLRLCVFGQPPLEKKENAMKEIRSALNLLDNLFFHGNQEKSTRQKS